MSEEVAQGKTEDMPDPPANVSETVMHVSIQGISDPLESLPENESQGNMQDISDPLASMCENETLGNIQDISDPPMHMHSPPAGKTQEISHILVRIFKEAYTAEIIGKDIVTNLKKSQRGDNTFHDAYVDEIVQVQEEYIQRMNTADMLARHIIEAQEQATAKEELARVKMVGDIGAAYSDICIPFQESMFRCCMDSNLLKSHNLICVEDFRLQHQSNKISLSESSEPGYEKPTFSFMKHIKSIPRDHAGVKMPPLRRSKQNILDMEETLTFSPTGSSNCSMGRSRKKASLTGTLQWPHQALESLGPEERKTLLRLRGHEDFLHNPRFLSPQSQRGGHSLIWPAKRTDKKSLLRESVHKAQAQNGSRWTNSIPDEAIPVFLVDPPVVVFSAYIQGEVYETTVELKNVTASSRQIRVIPPATPHFSVGLGKFLGEGGIVAPGMSCWYTVRFAPDCLADFEDILLVETQGQGTLAIPLKAERPPPILTLPKVLDCGSCLVGGVKHMQFDCSNEGLSSGTFCFMPKMTWPASSLQPVVSSSCVLQPPFEISPSLFELHPGQTTTVEVTFFPTTAESFSKDFLIVCDNCQVKDITAQGTGQLVDLQLISATDKEDHILSGEAFDVTAEYFIRFEPTNLYSMVQRTLVIRNNVQVDLPFYWQFRKPNLRPFLHVQESHPIHTECVPCLDDVFRITPQEGLLLPLKEHEFQLSYCPQEPKDYHSVCYLVLRSIPVTATKAYIKSSSQNTDGAIKVKDIITTEIEVKGTTMPLQVLFEPYTICFPGETFIKTVVKKRFKMWNYSKSSICFQWNRMTNCPIMEVEPSTGEIEANECCDLELLLMGEKPGNFTSSLQCRIQHNLQSIALFVEAIFKGPQVSICDLSLEFGVVRMGDQVSLRTQISNNTHLEASWVLKECQEDSLGGRIQVTVKPCKGVLPPLASCPVEVFLLPLVCHDFESVVELVVEDGTGSLVPVRAKIQSPWITLLSSDLDFSQLYVDMPTKVVTTICNQTLLHVNFSWGKIRGKQAALCSASFSPASGTLGPSAQLVVEVEFTAHTDMELTDVEAVCEVEGMKEPLILDLKCKATKLHISYSFPAVCKESESKESPLLLDFGDVLLREPASIELLMANKTAISTSFNMEVEFFTSQVPAPPPVGVSQSPRERSVYVRRPLHPIQAKKIEDKARQSFINHLLANGKGAVFFVQPTSGILGPFEIKTILITAYTAMWGEYQDVLISKVGDLEPVSIPIQMNVRGSPLYFQFMGSQLEKWIHGPIIRFGTHISGEDTVSRHLHLNNTSPYDIRLDWEVFNLEENDEKLLDVLLIFGEAFPKKDIDANEVQYPLEEEEFTDSSDESQNSQLSVANELVSVYIRIHEGAASDHPFCVTPQQMVVPAEGSTSLHASFTPLTLSGKPSNTACLSYALGFMSLDGKMVASKPGRVKRPQGLYLDPLRLEMQAFVSPACISIEMDEDDGLHFCGVASELLPADPQIEDLEESIVADIIRLSNNTEVPQQFWLHTEPPFSVFPSQRIPEKWPSLILQPQQTIQVDVAFHISETLLTYLSLPEDEVPAGVQLTTSETGERKLHFTKSLSVEHSNNTLQSVPLNACLSLPSLHISAHLLDFGVCYIGQSHIKEVFLFNQGESGSYWTATVEECCDSFSISPDCGTLKPPGYPISQRQLLQICFTPRELEAVKTTVTIKGILGELPIFLQVTGIGTFDEIYAW